MNTISNIRFLGLYESELRWVIQGRIPILNDFETFSIFFKTISLVTSMSSRMFDKLGKFVGQNVLVTNLRCW